MGKFLAQLMRGSLAEKDPLRDDLRGHGMAPAASLATRFSDPDQGVGRAGGFKF